MRYVATSILALGMLFGATPAFAVVTHSGSASGDTIYVGCRSGQTVVCDDGVLTVIEPDCTLSDNIIVYGNGGNDTITVVRSAAVSPYCNGTFTQITAVSYNGFFIDLCGGLNDDNLSGGTGDHIVAGNDGNDRVNVYSNVGYAAGDAGIDSVRSGYTGSGVDLYGGSTNDCVGIASPEPGAMPDILDCGNNSDEFVDVAGFTETGCEYPVSACQ